MAPRANRIKLKHSSPAMWLSHRPYLANTLAIPGSLINSGSFPTNSMLPGNSPTLKH